MLIWEGCALSPWSGNKRPALNRNRFDVRTGISVGHNLG